ncbi:major histocompatibility complex class I-related gene protein-like [Sardina pilchardus]|uniref:major histocompatibility complex class I-related gene protein-like n=1 Tax=Sardina pilchardus TaxID=27697 RepID=UPI002E0E4C1B
MAALVLAILLFKCFLFTWAEIHNLFRHCTAMSGINNFPDYVQRQVVDGQYCSNYSSAMQRNVPKNICFNDSLSPNYWDTSTKESVMMENGITEYFTLIKKDRNETVGVHVFQAIHYCWWNDKTNETGYFVTRAYDGVALIGLMAHAPKGLSGEDEFQRKEKCYRELNYYVTYAKKCLELTVAPDVSLFLSYSSSSSAVCHGTGFYPNGVNITWKRDGQVMENVNSTLPNGDGTFQSRAVITVSPEERRKSRYTCEVAHESGLIIKTLPEEEGSGIVIGSVILVFLLLIGALNVAFFCKRMRTQNETELAPQRQETKMLPLEAV